MPYTYTLLDAKNSVLKNIAGVCNSSEQFIEYVNEAQGRLMNRGDFFDQEQIVRFCIYNGCITYPRFVGAVLGMRFSCVGDIQLRNNWFAVIGPRHCSPGWNTSAVFTGRDAGTGPTYNNITGTTGKFIQAHIQHRTDIGKTIRIFGRRADTNLPVQEKDADGNWVDGLTLTLAATDVRSTILMRDITSVIKDRTQGFVFLYEYDPDTTLLRDLAMYEPSETNPRYRKMKIDNFACIPSTCQPSDGVTQKSADVLVNLQFIPVVTDSDWLFIDNFYALKFMIQAIRLEESNDDESAQLKMIKAISELNFESRKRNPGQQTTVRVNPTGRMIVNPL